MSRYTEHYEKLKADPVKYAAYLERKRAETRKRNEESLKSSDATYDAKRRKKWRESNPERNRLLRRAQNAVITALRSGELVRPKTCAECGSTGRIEAHHHLGYERVNWLNVKWLCVKCHRKADLPTFV